jgi:TonB family protein
LHDTRPDRRKNQGHWTVNKRLADVLDAVDQPPGSQTIPDLSRQPARFARYEVLDVIGRGATGCVYRALDPSTGREVAIKALRPSPWLADRSGDCRRRFQREAQAAGGLSHPNVVVIFDIGEDYFVMELVRGMTLRAHLDVDRVLSVDRALAILRPIADALDYAHRKGIVHCDVKPGSVMLQPDGVPKLMDFGGAHLESLIVTSAGPAAMSAAYLAPEQLRGERVTPATDIFALAAVAYEMLTGVPAFSGDPRRSLEPSTDGPRPASSWQSTLPTSCDQALARGLHGDPAERFATAEELVTALRPETAPPVNGSVRQAAIARLPPEVETQDLRLSTPDGRRARARSVARSTRAAVAILSLTLPVLGSSVTATSNVAPRIPPLPTPTSVLLLSEPVGAIVWLDGQPRGRTPLSLESVRPGIHLLRLGERGFAPVELVVSFTVGERNPLTVRLPSLGSGAVRPVKAAPSEARTAPPVPLGERVQPPRKLSGEAPRFPWDALVGRAGRVVVDLTVAEDGTPTDIRVEAPAPPIAQAASEAVRGWRFAPARRQGVAVRAPWRITYRLTARRAR